MDANWSQIDPALREEGEAAETRDGEYDGNGATPLGYNPQIPDQAEYDSQLDRDRRLRRKKLRRRFEHIFAKYGKDFEGVGDEIDIKTGLIVVDNGHLKNMRHEVDAGDSASSNMTKDHDGTVRDDKDPNVPGNGRTHEVTNDNQDSNDQDSIWRDASADSDAAPELILEHMPSLRDSVVSLRSKQKQGQGIDQDAIKSLGLSIAKQLTDLMSREDLDSSPRRRRKTPKDSAWSYPDLPRSTQQKRSHRSPSPLPGVTSPSSGKKSLWAPMEHPKRRKRRRIEEAQLPVDENEADQFVESHLQPGSDHKKCYNCQCTYSMTWRSGPEGHMCNACGMYWYRYGLVRPVQLLEESEHSQSEDSEADVEGSGHHTKIARRNDRFSKDEDVILIRLKEIDRLSWERIAKHLPGRTAYAIQCRYSKQLNRIPTESRAALANQGYESHIDENGLIIFAPAPPPQAFSDEDDELLLKLREEDELGWDEVAASFPGRTPKAIEVRFNQLVKIILSRPGSKRRSRQRKNRLSMRWSDEEDKLLKKLREIDKLKWHQLAEQFPGRNAVALQKRYVRELAETSKQRKEPTPSGDLNAVPNGSVEREQPQLSMTNGDLQTVTDGPMRRLRFTAQEDALILHLRDEDGLKWKEIAQRMPGRTSCSLYNRYNRAKDGIPQDTEPGAVEEVQHNHDHSAEGAQSDDELQDDDVNQSQPLLTASDRTHQNRATIATSTSDNPGTANDAQASRPSEKVRWTQEETDLLLRLREQNVRWEEIADQIPGRTVGALRICYHRLTGFDKRQSLPSKLDEEASLPHRAEDNNPRRHSASAPFSGRDGQPLLTNTVETTDDDATIQEDCRRQTANLESQTTKVLPSALPQQDASPVRRAGKPGTDTLLRTPECTQTAFAQPHDSTPLSDVPSMITPKYFTPARNNQHAHPYFVAAPAPMYTPAQGTQEQSAPPSRSETVNRPSETSPVTRSVPKGDVRPKVLRELVAVEPTPIISRFVRQAPVANVPKSRLSFGDAGRINDEPPNDGPANDDPADDAATSEKSDLHEDTSIHEDIDPPTADLEQPPLSWTQLITMALESKAPQPLRSKEVCDYIIHTFSYYKRNNNGWKSSIRTTLSFKPQFEKASNDFAALWKLSGNADVDEVESRKPSRPRSQPKTPLPDRDSPPNNRRVPRRLEQARKASSSTPLERRQARNAIESGTAQEESSAEDAEGAMHDQPRLETTMPEQEGYTGKPPGDGADAKRNDAGSDEPTMISSPARVSYPQPSDVSTEIATSTYPENDAKELPTTSIAAISTYREPNSTPKALNLLSHPDELSLPKDSSALSEVPKGALLSSSPILSRKKLTSRKVYGKTTTPATGRSSLFGRVEHRGVSALRSSFGPMSSGSRSSSIDISGSKKRVVFTPLKDAEGSEDELA
ncbi:hypothetical protein LTR37_012827 [Vermiconidia calcicola]|uniref:Uncharacterized protein n=1 Tax=Vermiconidia calcicola TaxID=1690605 RepID=A0ACC3MZL1_9PEZI|nr:hypothetical protein LTR37_012827 [Vermiconidia calcicola]